MKVSISAVNSPENTVISGDGKSLGAALKKMDEIGIRSHKLIVSHAFHSELIEPMLESFQDVTSRIEYNVPQIDLVSNVTGSVVQTIEALNGDYWCRQAREPVLFQASIQTLYEQGCRQFLEILPGGGR